MKGQKGWRPCTDRHNPLSLHAPQRKVNANGGATSRLHAATSEKTARSCVEHWNEGADGDAAERSFAAIRMTTRCDQNDHGARGGRRRLSAKCVENGESSATTTSVPICVGTAVRRSSALNRATKSFARSVRETILTPYRPSTPVMPLRGMGRGILIQGVALRSTPCYSRLATPRLQLRWRGGSLSRGTPTRQC
jgi:hypothetical protein